MPRKFDQDAKDRVVRLVEDRILAENMSMQAACKAVAPKLGVSWHTARQWTQQARRAGSIPEPVPGECLMVCVWEPIPHKEISQNDYCGETRSGR